MLLVVQDFIREEHINSDHNLDYTHSPAGKELKKRFGKIGVKPQDYLVKYAYAQIPKPVKINQKTGKVLSYKDPTLKELTPYIQELVDQIVELKPDMVIPTGNIACKAILGVSKIRSLRGKPEKVNLTSSTGEVMSVRVLPMFSMEYLSVQPNVVNLVDADFSVIKKFVKQGEDVFTPKDTEYTFIDSFEKAKELFTHLLKYEPITTWDLETNTLRPEITGAKVLVITFSYKEGEGYTLPMFHKDWRGWSKEELAQIMEWFKEFLARSTLIKVGQNIQFDIRFLRLTLGITEFNSNMDTKVLYWLVVTQEVDASFKLSDIAYQFTDMGGYDNPLEEFKQQYKKERLEQMYEELQEEKKRVIDELTIPFKEATVIYKEAVKAYKAYHRLVKSKGLQAAIDKYGEEPIIPDEPKKPALPKFRTKADLKLINEVDGSDFNYEWIPLSILHPYGSGDADCCLRIFNRLIEVVKTKPKMMDLAYNMYPKLTATLGILGATGVKLDQEYTEQLAKDYDAEIKRLTNLTREYDEVKQVEEYKEKLYHAGLAEMAKKPLDRDKEIAKFRDKYKDGKTAFNPTSSEDKGRLIFLIMKELIPWDKLYLKPKSLKDGVTEANSSWKDYSSNTAVLGYVVENSKIDTHKEICGLLIDISKATTLKNTFMTKPLLLSQADGRVHGKFNETGTETSRLSSSGPNMQNIPAKTGDVTRFDYTHPIKRMFVSEFADEGGAMIGADYQALELRIAGLVSGDEGMYKVFKEHGDLHTATACDTWGLTPEQVTKDIRKKAKAVSFGIVYGQTEYAFATANGVTVEEAKRLQSEYLQKKPKMANMINNLQQFAADHGYSQTLQGNERMIREVYAKDKKTYGEGMRKAVNTPIQGTGAFLTNTALYMIDAYLRKRKARSKLVLTVHDSIVIDCAGDELQEMAYVCKKIMENLPISFLKIMHNGKEEQYPIEADLEVGLNYNDMVDYDPEEVVTFSSIKGYIDYHYTLKTLQDYRDCNQITETQYEEAVQVIESRLDFYKNM